MAQKFFIQGPGKWVLLPLRLFLGITFIYAGIQKLTDPQFFRPDAAGYIGKQLGAFAQISPLHSFLLQSAVPHATLFGLLVTYGEIAIGLGTLIGFLLRPAACFGLLISLIFFLTATWRVYPYFYGADIVFVFCWLTLLLNGPINTGLPTLDEILSIQWLQRVDPQRQRQRAHILQICLGIPLSEQTRLSANRPGPTLNAQPNTSSRQPALARQQEARRHFLSGTLAGIAGTLGLAAFAYAWHILVTPTNATPPATTVDSAPPTPLPTTDGVPANTPTATPGTGTTGGVAKISTVSAVPKNSAVNFALPNAENPGVLIHLNDDRFVAYDSTCTHAGCQVDYDPSTHLLICPCHGAQFDPAQQAQVVNPPASTPLTSVAIHIDSATGAISLSGS